MAQLFLLDGTALAYRSHFAMARSGLTDTEGRPTGATYGFTMTLRRLLETEDPGLVAVAFDPPGPTFRHEEFAEYKATREKMPDELLTQLDDVRAVVRAHGIPIFEVPGYEADDVLGTLARAAEAAGHDTRIVTGDKDFMQLVSDKIRLYNVFKQGVDVLIEDEEAVEAKFGTTPDHVIDVLAIMGDSSDNVPGVKGIGEKGAVKLIKEFGSVEGLLERLDEVKGKAREHIERDREQLLLSLDLVTIRCDVPLDPGFESIGAPAPDKEALLELYKRLDFKTLIEKLAETGGGRGAEEFETDYRRIEDAAQLDELVEELEQAGAFALRCVQTSPLPLQGELVGLAFSAAEGRAAYVPLNAEPAVLDGGPEAVIERLRPVLTGGRCERIGHNAKADALALAPFDVVLPTPDFDTEVASFCAAGSGRRLSLDDLALQHFDRTKTPASQLLGTGAKAITMERVPVAEVCEFACEEADLIFRLRPALAAELKEMGVEGLYRELELPLVPVLAVMEQRGIRVDTSVLDEMREELEADIEQAVHDIQGMAGENINVNSTKALGEVLFEKLRIQDEAGVKRPKKTKTGWATDHAYLSEKFGDVPIVRRLLEYREVSKLKSTYVDALPHHIHADTGRIHCTFSQVSAATGRLASSDPNLQNIPVRTERGRRLRSAFVPREADEHGEWVLLAADYSQVELRLMAHFSGDPEMKRAFAEGRDIHASTAAVVFDIMPELVDREMRSRAKAINFGLLYGMGPARLARDTGLTTAEAKRFIERYFSSFPKVRGWIDGLLTSARETGYVETLFGRRRHIPEIQGSNQRARAFAENAAVNTPIQGSAADIIKRAMIDLEARLAAREDLAGVMLLQVHDELVLEVPKNQLDETREVVRECMEGAADLSVPLHVDFGSGGDWLEAH